MVTTEMIIAKITEKNEFGVLTGVAESMEWAVHGKFFMSNRELKVGDYVLCYVLEEDEEFYLEEVPHEDLKTKKQWKEQEENV